MKINLNIDLEKIKSMSKKLKKELENSGVKLSLMQCYEIVSKQIGFKNYNTALAMIKNGNQGIKTLSYTFNTKNEKIKNRLLVKIEDSIKRLYQLNNNFSHDLFVYDEIITLNLYFEPNKMANDGMIIDVLMITSFKEEMIKNKLIVEKRDLLIRDEKTSINKSLIKALIP